MADTRIEIDWPGTGLMVTSAAGFATLAIFGKMTYAEHLLLPTSLSLRFGGAALFLWAYLLAYRRLPRLPARTVAGLLLMGCVGYAGQTALYFGSLYFIDASLTGMLLYTYPAFVTLLMWGFAGKRPASGQMFALGLASLGVVLTTGGAVGAVNWLGVALGLGAGLWYSFYIVIGDRVTSGVAPDHSTVLVTTGATLSYLLVGLLTASLNYQLSATGWGAIVGMIVLSTIVPIVAFFAGLSRLGPVQAAILSTLEPVFTVLMAGVFLGERLSPVQAVGGLCIVGAVWLIQASGARAVPARPASSSAGD
jgi:drug/metabolite transporter (DMT)-like permease